jgi:hypothetical protein
MSQRRTVREGAPGFASKVRSCDVSFTPDFSPVTAEIKTKNRFNGLLFVAKNEAVEYQQVTSTGVARKPLKRFPDFFAALDTGLKPGVNETPPLRTFEANPVRPADTRVLAKSYVRRLHKHL